MRSRRVWLAAVSAVVASWFVLALTGLFLRTLRALAEALPADHGWPLPLMLSLIGGLLGAAGVEACKMAAVRWICLRRWEGWAPLGVAFGVLKAVGVLVSWTLDRLSFGQFIAFSATLFVAAARALLLHFALGRLATGAARRPGSPWLAFGLAACAHVVFANG